MTREEYYCNEFLEKIYYFCLKKTGDVLAAEDLSSEISTEILTALHKGVLPEHMEAWVWQIARNRFARWVRQKKINGAEIFDEEAVAQIATEDNVEDAVLQPEEVQELRRELCLLTKEYRELLVAYYVENQRIATIAQTLSVPEGTVKTRLAKAREKLKEGMQMARTFGKLSYAPEEIEFSQSGGRSENWAPDCYLDEPMYDKICKNILIEAYRNPSTLQELSIELGIAMPYLEGFVEAMTEDTLLIKNGTKAETATYETNFVIISAEAKRKMVDKLAQIQGDFVPLAEEYLKTARQLQLAAGNHILGQFQDYEEQKWTLALRLADDIQWTVYDRRNLQFCYDTVRPGGGSWDVMGVQEYHGPSFYGVGHSCGEEPGGGRIDMFVTDKQVEKGDDRTFACMRDNVKVLHQVLHGQAEKASERELEELADFVRKTPEGKYEVTFGVYSKEHNSDTLRYGVPVEKYNEMLLPIYEKMLALADDYLAYCETVMRGEVPKRLMSQFNFCMHSVPFLRGMVVEGLLKSGFLKPEEELSLMIGVYTTV